MLVLLISTLIAVAFAHTKMSLHVAKNVSFKCCPSEAVECCTNVIQHSLPLKCDNMTPDSTLKAAHCIQKQLFPISNSSHDTFTIQDLACCDVYTRNDADPSNTCFHHCTNSVMTVGLKPSERLKKVKTCHNGKRLNTCFNHCLGYLHRHKYRKNFVFSEHCLWKNRMIPGKLYVGSSVR